MKKKEARTSGPGPTGGRKSRRWSTTRDMGKMRLDWETAAKFCYRGYRGILGQELTKACR